MFCVHCGKALPDDAMFCPFCGKATVVEASSTPEQSPTPGSSEPTPPVETPASVPASSEEASEVSPTANSPEAAVPPESELPFEEEASAAPPTVAAVSQPSISASQKGGKHGLVIGLCIALVAVLALAIWAAISRPGNDQVAGVWKLDHSILEGTEMTATELGTDIYIYLSENGSAEFTVSSGSVEREFGRWKLIDSKTLLLTLTSTGEEIRFSRSRYTLSAPYGGVTMCFTRSNISPSQIPTPNFTAGADLAQGFTEPPASIPTQPTINYTLVSMQQLYDELHSNALRAKNTYEDMYIVTVGVLVGVDNDGEYFTIHDPYDDRTWMDNLLCDITTENQLQTLVNLDEGDIVTVRGKVTTVGEVLGYSIDLDQLEYGDTTYYYEDTGDSYTEELDYSWLEGEYEKAHDVNISMVLYVDDLIPTEIYVQFLEYNPSGETELLAEGPASYVRGGASPRFEGYLYNSTMDPVTIEYDDGSYNFTVDCSALGFFGATFTDLF